MNGVSRQFAIGIRVVAAMVAVGLFVSLAGRTLAPGGELSVTSDFWAPAPFVSEPKPGERLERIAYGQDGAMSEMVGRPVYLDLKPPGGFQSVVQTVRYRNPEGATVELGALASTWDNQFDLRPGESRLLDSLPWQRLESGRLALFQREHRYGSVDELLADPPSRAELAVWGTTAAGIPYRIDDYRPLGRSWEASVSLRGQHRFLTYIDNETLDLTFTVQDMNRSLGADPAIVTVYSEGQDEPLARTVLDDDGNTADDQKSSGLRKVSVTADGLPAGAYQVEFTSSSDLFIRHLRSAQRYLVLAGRVYFGDYIGYSDRVPPAKAWSDGRRLSALTPHAEGRQTVRVGERWLELTEPLIKASVGMEPADGQATVPVIAPKRNVLLETDGVFALTPESYFNPLPLEIKWHMTADDLDRRGIRYVLADYRPPQADGELKTVSAEYRTDRLARTEGGAWRFLIEVPGLDESQQSVAIESVSFSLRRAPMPWYRLLASLFSSLAESPAGPELVLPTGRSYEESPE